MYIFQNAIKNLGRNKGRNLMMGIIILVIIISTAVSLIINTTTQGIIDDYKSRFGSSVSIYRDMEKMQSSGTMGGFSASPLTLEQYRKLAESETLKSYIFNNELAGISNTLKAVGENSQNNQGGVGVWGDTGSQEDMPQAIQLTFKIKGTNDVSSMTEFANGTRKITEGKGFENPNECIISKELAELNNIHIGDEIVIMDALDEEKSSMKLKVTGIYTDSTEEYGGSPYKTPYVNRRNEILTDFDTVIQNAGNEETVAITASFILKSPDLLDEFTKDARAAGLSDLYKISTDEQTYNRIVGPVEGLKKITVTFMWIVLSLGGAILLFLSLMAIRERKYEIGVLRAMGMGKGKLVLQFLTETLALTALCLVIGVSIGAAISQPVADSLLKDQIEASEQNNASMNGMSSVGNGTNRDVSQIQKLNVSLNSSSMVKISVIGIGLATLSSAAAVVYITKYEPIQILSERNE